MSTRWAAYQGGLEQKKCAGPYSMHCQLVPRLLRQGEVERLETSLLLCQSSTGLCLDNMGTCLAVQFSSQVSSPLYKAVQRNQEFWAWGWYVLIRCSVTTV